MAIGICNRIQLIVDAFKPYVINVEIIIGGEAQKKIFVLQTNLKPINA